MSRFGLVGPAYRSQSINADCQTCINWYPEAVESQQGKGPMVLNPTPGLRLRYSLGTAGVRGEITAQGRSFAVAGTVLWELLPPYSTPNTINRGTVLSDGLPVSMADGPNQLVIISSGSGYVYDMTANTLTDLTTALGAPPVFQTGYADGFFFALFANSNRVQSSDPLDATSWPGENAIIVSVFPDNVNAMFIDHKEMWLFGSRATQPYGDAGDFPEPFDAIGGAYIETGIAAPFSPAKLDNSIFWLGADERGDGMVWRAQGYVPSRVSNHAIEYALQSYSRIDDAVGYSYQDQGHSFYVLSFPTASKTWVYDAATGMWHERGFWNSTAGIFTQHRAQYHTKNFGMHLVGDPTTGSIYEMSINVPDDFGNPIRRVRRAPHISDEQGWIFHNRLQVDAETGLGPVPPLPGSAPPTIATVSDSLGAIWSISVNDLGIVRADAGTGTPAEFFLNDPGNTTSWAITVNQFGVADADPAPFNAGYARASAFISTGGTKRWTLQVHPVTATAAVLQTFENGIVTRGPQMMMRFSDDGGHTWSKEYLRDCGQAGEYKKRVIWRRLGRSRDRVYEIAVSDPIPWRIVDAYLDADPGYAPQERMAHQMRKTA